MHLGAFCCEGENGKKTSVVIIDMATFLLSFNSWECFPYYQGQKQHRRAWSIYRLPVLYLSSSKNNWGLSYSGKSFSDITKERALPQMASAKTGSIVAADNLDLCISICKLRIFFLKKGVILRKVTKLRLFQLLNTVDLILIYPVWRSFTTDVDQVLCVFSNLL